MSDFLCAICANVCVCLCEVFDGQTAFRRILDSCVILQFLMINQSVKFGSKFEASSFNLFFPLLDGIVPSLVPVLSRGTCRSMKTEKFHEVCMICLEDRFYLRQF